MIPRSRMLAGLAWALTLVVVAHGEVPPPKAAPALEEMRQLIQQLGDDDYGVREVASDRLLALGAPALPLLEMATESLDPEVRQRAWRIIDTHAAAGEVSALLFQLSCSNAPVRASAAESLGKLEGKGQPALLSLIKATCDQTEYVRCNAQEAVKKIQATLPVRVDVKHNSEAIDLNGETFFRIEVSNQGKTTAANLRIQAFLPDQVTLTSVQGPVKHHKEGRQIICETFTLEPNESRFCEVHVKAKKPGAASLKVEVTGGELEAPLLGEGNININPASGQ